MEDAANNTEIDIDLESRHPSIEPMKLGTELSTERGLYNF